MRAIIAGVVFTLGTAPLFGQVSNYPPSAFPGVAEAAEPAPRAKRTFSLAGMTGNDSIIKTALSSNADDGGILPTSADLGAVPRGTGYQPLNTAESCGPGCGCGPPGQFWGSVEWLYWITSGQSIPPLVTTAPPNTPLATAGVLGQPGTAILFGNQRYNNDWRNGIRTTAGMWFDESQKCGVEFDSFFLGRSRMAFTDSSDGSRIITRPFFNTQLGRPDTELVSFPGIVGGAVVADPSTNVVGAGVNYIHNLKCCTCERTDLILGYRYFHLGDIVNITENLVALPGSAVTPGTNFFIQDQFHTSNNFNGGVIGIAHERRFSHYYINVRATVALGDNEQVTNVDGSTVIRVPGAEPVTYPGGLLTQYSNIGQYKHHAFAVMPEVGLKFGVQLTENARVYGGYNFIYLSNVIRAGDQINLALNTSQLPPATNITGAPAPITERHATDFWMQGVSVGAELRF